MPSKLSRNVFQHGTRYPDKISLTFVGRDIYTGARLPKTYLLRILSQETSRGCTEKKKKSKSGRRKLLRDPGKQKKMATRMPRMTVQKNKKIQSSNRAASLQSQHRRGQVRKLQARKRISKALLFTEYFTCDVRVGNETF